VLSRTEHFRDCPGIILTHTALDRVYPLSRVCQDDGAAGRTTVPLTPSSAQDARENLVAGSVWAATIQSTKNGTSVVETGWSGIRK